MDRLIDNRAYCLANIGKKLCTPTQSMPTKNKIAKCSLS